jgi:hypothetical protein
VNVIHAQRVFHHPARPVPMEREGTGPANETVPIHRRGLPVDDHAGGRRYGTSRARKTSCEPLLVTVVAPTVISPSKPPVT